MILDVCKSWEDGTEHSHMLLIWNLPLLASYDHGIFLKIKKPTLAHDHELNSRPVSNLFLVKDHRGQNQPQ